MSRHHPRRTRRATTRQREKTYADIAGGLLIVASVAALAAWLRVAILLGA